MILCKGKRCNCKQYCSRYVIGKAMADMTKQQTPDAENNTWINQFRGAQKFEIIKD